MAEAIVKPNLEDTLAHILALRDLAINRIHKNGQWGQAGEMKWTPEIGPNVKV